MQFKKYKVPENVSAKSFVRNTWQHNLDAKILLKIYVRGQSLAVEHLFWSDILWNTSITETYRDSLTRFIHVLKDYQPGLFASRAICPLHLLFAWA